MEENQVEEQEDGRNCITEQPLNFSFDAHFANWQELMPAGAISTSLINKHSEILMKQKGFNLPSQKLKAKRRKIPEIIEVNGGRIIRAAGRKDRHSKVCTARGTRDRRVRLSPKTAIQFYDVQDRLSYDRPSKAIDWLMNEAKAAIDALDEPPPPTANNNHIVSTNFAEISNYDPGNGEIQQIHSVNPVLLNEGSFGFLTNNGAGYSDAGGLEYFSSAPLTTPDEIFDANLEVAKMQRIFTWNYANNSPPDHFPGPSGLCHGHTFSQREPLQSSYSRITNYNPISTRFPGFDFSNEELPDFTTPEENEMDNKIPVSGEPSSTASFLHYED